MYGRNAPDIPSTPRVRFHDASSGQWRLNWDSWNTTRSRNVRGTPIRTKMEKYTLRSVERLHISTITHYFGIFQFVSLSSLAFLGYRSAIIGRRPLRGRWSSVVLVDKASMPRQYIWYLARMGVSFGFTPSYMFAVVNYHIVDSRRWRLLTTFCVGLSFKIPLRTKHTFVFAHSTRYLHGLSGN